MSRSRCSAPPRINQIQKWQADLVKFFTSLGRLKAEEGEKLQAGSYINDKFLKMIK